MSAIRVIASLPDIKFIERLCIIEKVATLNFRGNLLKQFSNITTKPTTKRDRTVLNRNFSDSVITLEVQRNAEHPRTS